MSKERFKLHVFAGLILWKKDEVLLMKRASTAVGGIILVF
jgi:hypothetical protein